MTLSNVFSLYYKPKNITRKLSRGEKKLYIYIHTHTHIYQYQGYQLNISTAVLLYSTKTVLVLEGHVTFLLNYLRGVWKVQGIS
jgi:hypothetical protein